ncbi:PAAR-like domain-containing protein [Vibrio parahaemolyticus]|uniref:PAAR-like domain-containing protein n=1 Tax=Vibrio parahaemolyticus TaxID=670 RepID=UPI00356B63D2
MDGGSSVAVKGSTFSKSTGDAGGDKKGVASGTIEAEAKFISASPTVKFEGKGVCRLSDQMTMNKANTMCLSGAQNPSVSVTEEQEGTYTLYIECRYPDGEPLANAKFKVFDGNNAEIGSGVLDSNGRSSVSSLPPGECYVVYEEDSRKYEAKTSRGLNGHKYEWSDDELFAHCAKEKLPFWEPRSVDSVRSTWGVFDENLGSDKDFISMLATEVRAHFEYELTEKEANDISQNIALLFGTNDDYSVVANELIAQVAPIIDKNGVTLNLLHSIHEDESHNNILALLRQQGYGDSEKYLKELNWNDWTKLVSGQLDTILSKVAQRFDALSKYASMKGYQVAYDTLQVQAKSANEVKAKLPDITASGMEKLQEKSSKLISNGAKPKVVNNFSNGQTTQSEKVSDVVHAERTLPVPFALELCYDDKEKTPVSNVPYRLTYSSGEVFEGLLNGKGVASVYGVPQHEVPKIEFGDPDKAAKAEAGRPAQLDVLKEEIKKYADYLVKETIAYNATQPSPQKELLEELKAQTEEELNELRARKAELDSASTTEYLWEMAKSSIEGVGDGVTNYVPDFGEIGDYLDALDIDLSVLIYAITTGDIDELEEALKRVDRGALYLQEATEAMERLLLIISDQEIREYLLTIPQLYLDALPADEAVKYSLSLATQKGIDGAIVVGGTAAGTAAGGVPAMAVLLTGATTARSSGKVIERLVKVLNDVVAGKKHSKNNHKEKPKDDETELDKICPICRDSKCKNRKRLKKGKGQNKKGGYLDAMEKAYRSKGKSYPEGHDWYVGTGSLEVHHVIPLEAVSDDVFKELFDDFRHDINDVHNLEALPGIMELACELGVQRHQGNHAQGMALSENEKALSILEGHETNARHENIKSFNRKLFKNNKIQGNELRYPKAAKNQVLDLKDRVEKGVLCKYADNTKKVNMMFEREMKKHSKKILGYIQDFTWTIAYDGRDYRQGGPGCSNVSTIKQKRKGLQRANFCEARDHGFGLGRFNGTLKLGK